MEIPLVDAVAPFEAYVGRIGLVEHIESRPFVVVARAVRTHAELVVLPNKVIPAFWADLRIAERIRGNGGKKHRTEKRNHAINS